MIRRTIEIISSSFKMAMLELWKNKLRTFLSLFGITIGIFCIIGVLATVNSLEQNIKNEVNSLGNNTIYIDKWEYTAGGNDYPWWKYVNRPDPKFEEMKSLKMRVPSASNVAFNTNTQDKIEFEDDQLSNVNYYGVTEDFVNIQPVEILIGRYLQQADYDYESNTVVMGYLISEKMFGKAENAFGKQIKLRNGNSK